MLNLKLKIQKQKENESDPLEYFQSDISIDPNSTNIKEKILSSINITDYHKYQISYNDGDDNCTADSDEEFKIAFNDFTKNNREIEFTINIVNLGNSSFLYKTNDNLNFSEQVDQAKQASEEENPPEFSMRAGGIFSTKKKKDEDINITDDNELQNMKKIYDLQEELTQVKNEKDDEIQKMKEEIEKLKENEEKMNKEKKDLEDKIKAEIELKNKDNKEKQDLVTKLNKEKQEMEIKFKKELEEHTQKINETVTKFDNEKKKILEDENKKKEELKKKLEEETQSKIKIEKEKIEKNFKENLTKQLEEEKILSGTGSGCLSGRACRDLFPY